MKTRYLVQAASAALLALSFSVAYAQASDTAAMAPAAAASSSTATPKQSRAANRKLAQSVRHALYHTKGLQAGHISVLAKNGVVTLNGTVTDQSQIAVAGTAAQGVNGVDSVKNNVVLYQKP